MFTAVQKANILAVSRELQQYFMYMEVDEIVNRVTEMHIHYLR